MADVDCPRCGNSVLKSHGTEVERWGYVRELEELECLRCDLIFEREV